MTIQLALLAVLTGLLIGGLFLMLMMGSLGIFPEFLIQWKAYGFRIALNNWLIGFTKWFIKAKKITITYYK